MDTVGEILKLKKEKNAVILAHNYQRPEIQRVADFVGDSLALSTQANDLECEVIVFCGPDFMVEAAAILNPDKVVLYANREARCPMAAMCDVEELRVVKDQYPDAKVVGYFNTAAECKTEIDICCTSANAVDIIKSLDAQKIIFVPDVNLGLYVKRFITDKELILWPGYCTIHQVIRREDILELARAHPQAKIIVHPECIPEVIDLADAVRSTDGMVEYASLSPSTEFIIGTEREMIHRLTKEVPGKKFYPIETAFCRTQKKIKLNDVLRALQTLEPSVNLPDDVVVKARRPIEKMLAFGRGN